jgi:ferredoxin
MTAAEDETWRVDVDSSVCIGSGMCANIAPARFRLVNYRSRPVRDRTRPDELVLEASENCPVEAILVRDERTGAVLAPGKH